jgi:small-conductance mechanosensitive channel
MPNHTQDESVKHFIVSCTLAISIALSLCPGTATAQDTAQQTDAQASPSSEAQQQTVRRLLTIRQALEERRARVRELLEELGQADEADKDKIRQQVAALRDTISELTRSFENIAVGGVSLRGFEDDSSLQLSWHDELMQVARPLLNSLKQATEKPRRIEELRREIAIYQEQSEITRKAIESLSRFEQQQLPPAVAEGLADVAQNWRERSSDIGRSLAIARDELHNLETDSVPLLQTLGSVAREFFLGRGLTLSIAVLSGLLVWLVLRTLRRFVRARRRAEPHSDQAARLRLLLYAYHLFTMVLVSVAVLTVFYVRGDLLLLSLAIIALVMLALGAWRYLPRYLMEGRLLLNVGAARQGERVIYHNLPFRITSLNLYSELRNPELEGVIRLPLTALAQLISRPRGGEDWFPCRVGDYLLLPDGAFAQVLQQTIERVRLKVMGSTVEYPAAEFLQLAVRNLSREGFGIAVTFGIDYQHQSIALDTVPRVMREGITRAFADAEYGASLKDLLVEFKAANASSLDYLVYATMDGSSAASYFAIGRLIQRSCVDICNREGWVIPFTQVTVHQAELASPPAASTSATQPA